MQEHINWSKFSKLILRAIQFYSRNTELPVGAEQWEELLCSVFREMGYSVTWTPGGHAKGVDLEVCVDSENKILISAKSGKIKNDNISLSSYRLTRYKTLEEKLAFLRENAETLDCYLFCPREELKGERVYHIIKIDSEALTPDRLLNSRNWVEDAAGWKFVAEELVGFSAKIVRKMSDQLWYSIPQNSRILEHLAEIRIKRDELGVKLKENL